MRRTRTKDNHKLMITQSDSLRLRRMLQSARKFLGDRQYVEELEERLENAEVIAVGRVPENVVTINASARVTDLEAGKQTVYTVVFPRDANFSENRISVLAPIGAALLGDRPGDVVEVAAPGGRRTLRVEEVYPTLDEQGHAA